jgi:hypothetical protein
MVNSLHSSSFIINNSCTCNNNNNSNSIGAADKSKLPIISSSKLFRARLGLDPYLIDNFPHGKVSDIFEEKKILSKLNFEI